ncbi:MAG: asparagine synthase (glutamine-hydrolyzing) [Clostridia bacterium]|nr:asparagine synthase (glutamine-hydrolyzing) [Clostridia bacterium]
MCSICGEIDFLEPFSVDEAIVRRMNGTMKHRGPDESDFFKDNGVLLGHNRLSVMDPENGQQPFTIEYGNKKYTIVYNGEIYNCDEIKKDIRRRNIFLKTNCDTEVVLYSYILYGVDCPKHLNGIFAFAIYDGESVFLARDRFGVKPLYYSLKGSHLLFASEIKALLSSPLVSRDVTKRGLWEILYLSPNFVGGRSVFKDILELLPAECMIFKGGELKKWKYWSLTPLPFFKDRNYAIEKTKYLVYDAIKRQLDADVGLCVLLSGGLDSSVVTAVASHEYKKQGRVLSTYSFEYEGNKESFKNSLFQPNPDDEFAIYLADYLGTSHRVLTCPTRELASNLIPSCEYRDLPGQADIDSSLLYFCKEIKKNHTVGLSGECSDEIFGGYPWFYRPEMLYSDFFPWIHSPRLRPSLFKDSISNSDEGFDYIRSIYKNSLEECPVLSSDSEEMKTSRVATYLSVNYFMTSLLQRKDRMSMASGVEIRVPFADHRILEFLYNVPWEIKFENKVEKALLRNAMVDYLPEKILWRKKSPYPKTHNPEYMRLVTSLLEERLKKGGYLSEHLDRAKLNEIIESGGTWFGQLMDTPQLIAWLIQFDFWIEHNHINIVD